MRPRHECLGISPKTGLDVRFHRWNGKGVCINRGCGITKREVRRELREREREAIASIRRHK